MRLNRLIILTFVIVLSFSIADSVNAFFFPPLPSSFYGSVKLNDQNVPANTIVRALIDGKPVTESRVLIYQGESVYSIDVRGDDPETHDKDGGVEGDKVQFEVGGVLMTQTGTWHSGKNVELRLTLNSNKTLNTPSATEIPLPTQTDIFPGLSTPTQSAGAASTTVSGNQPVYWVLGIGIGVLILLAAVQMLFKKSKK